jgi:dipeptidyl aminopeptidase/acylaminoacyl peptidase
MSKRRVHWKSLALKADRWATAGLVHHRWPAWSPDGEWLAFAAGDGRDAAWVIADRRGRVARTLEGPADGGAGFAHGARLAFGRRVASGAEIWLTPGAGAPPLRLLGGDGRSYRQPAWSPDGRSLAFALADEHGARTQLWLLDIASGDRRPLLPDDGRSNGRPAFAPGDGDAASLLYYESIASDGDVAVFALDLRAGAVERVTPTGVACRHPAPLSRELVIVERGRDKGAAELVLIDRARGREGLLDDGADRREPAAVLLPDGRIRLAWSELTSHASGEPRRFDIGTARLRGIDAEEPAHAAQPQPATNGSMGPTGPMGQGGEVSL